MAILIPIVSIISILVHGSLLYSFVFALSIAIGLTPELLPMIIMQAGIMELAVHLEQAEARRFIYEQMIQKLKILPSKIHLMKQ